MAQEKKKISRRLIDLHPTAPISKFGTINDNPIGRNKFQKILIAVSLFYLFVGIAWLSISRSYAAVRLHGTHIEVLYRDDAIIIAADSRQTEDERPIEQETCKILALGPHDLFVASGPFVTLIGTLANGERQTLIDAYGTARAAFLQTETSLVADLWAETIGDRFNHIMHTPGVKPSLKTNDTIVMGGFFGEQKDGSLYGAVRRITFFADGPSFVHVSTETDIKSTSGMPLFLGAPHLDLVREFLNNQSTRAQSVIDNMNKKIASDPVTGIEVPAIILKTLAESIIKWADDPKIGGVVSVAVLERGKTVRWFSRSPACGG